MGDSALASLPLGVKEPDLVVEILGSHIMVKARNQQATSVEWSPNDELREYLEDKYKQLATLARGSERLGPLEASVTNTARGVGVFLYRHFAPPTFKQALERLLVEAPEGERLSLQIYSDNPLLPWELLVPEFEASPRRYSHLSLETGISRWHARQDGQVMRSPPHRLQLDEIVVVAPEYSSQLPAVRSEVEILREFATNSTLQVATEVATAAAALTRLPKGLLHFAGHGRVVRGDLSTPAYQLLLDDDQQLSVDQWRGSTSSSLSSPALVFFNACDVGRSGTSASVVDGWAPALLDAGASGYLGALWPVTDSAAGAFARRFYETLAEQLEGGSAANVLDAVAAARELFLETGDPSYAAYVFYGDSELSLSIDDGSG